MAGNNKEAVLAAGTITAFELDKVGAAGVYTVVDGINSFGAVGETGEAKDQTTLVDTVKRYGRGIKDTPEQSVKAYHLADNTNQETFIQKAIDQDLLSMMIIYPSGRQALIDLQLLGFQMDENTAEDWESFTVAARQSGAVIWTPPSADATPEPLAFVDQTDVAVTTLIPSAPVIISGMTQAAVIAVTGGTYSINGGTQTSNVGIVNTGDSVVEVMSSAAPSTETKATINVGGVTDDFSVTTAA